MECCVVHGRPTAGIEKILGAEGEDSSFELLELLHHSPCCLSAATCNCNQERRDSLPAYSSAIEAAGKSIDCQQGATEVKREM